MATRSYRFSGLLVIPFTKIIIQSITSDHLFLQAFKVRNLGNARPLRERITLKSSLHLSRQPSQAFTS